MIPIVAIILSFGLTGQKMDTVKDDIPQKQRYDVAAIVWPSYHPDEQG